jgi:peptidoglycan/xylan/chitin deacetylase (PgdA/CDA1 family)
MNTPSELWPGGTQAAVSVTFDNLGEAAEQELGLPTPTGGHYSVVTALPIVLAELADAGIAATFFVEGVNAETYPEALREIAAEGYECAYHAWRHEDWRRLTEAQERENLARGLEALRSCGLEPSGFRPPGGLLKDGTLELLAANGLRYCSPAGSGAAAGEVAVLPFEWRNVDAYHLLPQFEALRRHIDGDGRPGGPDGIGEQLIAAIDGALDAGAYVALVIHTWLIEAELDSVRAVLCHLRERVQRGEAWVARCDEVAAWLRERSDAVEGAVLDTTSWLAPSVVSDAG